MAKVMEAVAVRRAAPGAEDPVARGGEGRGLLVGGESLGELVDQRHLAHRGGRLRRHSPCGLSAMGARELRPDADQPAAEVDVSPDEPQQLGDPQAPR